MKDIINLSLYNAGLSINAEDRMEARKYLVGLLYDAVSEEFQADYVPSYTYPRGEFTERIYLRGTKIKKTTILR